MDKPYFSPQRVTLIFISTCVAIIVGVGSIALSLYIERNTPMKFFAGWVIGLLACLAIDAIFFNTKRRDTAMKDYLRFVWKKFKIPVILMSIASTTGLFSWVFAWPNPSNFVIGSTIFNIIVWIVLFFLTRNSYKTYIKYGWDW